MAFPDGRGSGKPEGDRYAVFGEDGVQLYPYRTVPDGGQPGEEYVPALYGGGNCGTKKAFGEA